MQRLAYWRNDKIGFSYQDVAYCKHSNIDKDIVPCQEYLLGKSFCKGKKELAY